MDEQITVVHINTRDLYPLDAIARLAQLSVNEVCYWIAKRQIEVVDDKIQGFWALIFRFLQEQKDLEDSRPVDPRQIFQKHLKLACMLKHSEAGGYLYGDYRVNEFVIDLVDLIDYFLTSESLARITHSAEEIYKQFGAKHRSMSEEEREQFDWASQEGNIDNDEAADLYRKLRRFRVFTQGRERYIKNTIDCIKNMVSEDFPGNTIIFEETQYDSIFRIEICGDATYRLRSTLENDGDFRIVAAPGKEERDYYLVFC